MSIPGSKMERSELGSRKLEDLGTVRDDKVDSVYMAILCG